MRAAPVTRSPKFKAIVDNYILSAIDGEGYEKTFSNDTEKLQFLADTFKSEYCYPENLKRYGSYQETLRNWIMGLPSVFNIDFENYRILELSKEWGSLPANATEKQEDKLLENWFNFIAAKTLQLMNKHSIKIS
jgi:hypothetical protein